MIYLMIALPVLVFQAIAMPPFQSADEDNHFLRVIALSRGELVGTRLSDVSAGGIVDEAAVRAAHALDWLKFKPERHVTPEARAALRLLRWWPVKLVPADFGNTAIYPPWFYAPAITAVLASRAARMPVMSSLLLARLATGLAGAVLGATAIALARRGRALTFALLSLPMSLSLLGSCSQDSLMIAAAALAAALLGRGETRRQLIGAGLLLGMIAAAKPPYAPMLLLAVLTGSRGRLGRRGLLPLGAVMLVPLLWIPFGVVPMSIIIRPGDNVSIAGQLGFILAHPGEMFTVIRSTLAGEGADYWREVIGVLGWLDTVLPRAAYKIAELMLAIAVLLELSSTQPARRCWTMLACLATLLATALLLMSMLYLSWTPVGAPMVEGIQGRYMIPILLFLPLALPNWGGVPKVSQAARAWPNVVRACGWAFLYASAAASLWFLPTTVMARYYG